MFFRIIAAGLALSACILPVEAQQVEGVKPCRVYGDIGLNQYADLRLVGTLVSGIDAIPFKLSYTFEIGSDSLETKVSGFSAIESVPQSIIISLNGNIDPVTKAIHYQEVLAHVSGYKPTQWQGQNTQNFMAAYMDTSAEQIASVIPPKLSDSTNQTFGTGLSARVFNHIDISGEKNLRQQLRTIAASVVETDLQAKNPISVDFLSMGGAGVRTKLDTTFVTLEANEARLTETAEKLLSIAQALNCNPYAQ